LQIASKDAVITDLQNKNEALSCKFVDVQAINDDLHQKLKRDNLTCTGFTPPYCEIADGERRKNKRCVSVEASINSVVTFRHKALAMPEITLRDILFTVFLPPPKSGTTISRLLYVQITLCVTTSLPCDINSKLSTKTQA
jgi:hypothetical protein